MKVDEALRSSGRFNLDRVAQEHMNKGLQNMDTTRTRPFYEKSRERSNQTIIGHCTAGLTPSSTIGSHTGTGTTRLKELQERLQ